MKYIKSISIILFLFYSLTGCSYVSDYVEGQITNRASFSINAEYRTGPDRVVLTWTETDTSDDCAGIEIYRSKYANDEYAPYEIISKESSVTNSYSDTAFISGVSFYRVGFIHYDDKDESMDYNSATHISKVSGYAKVVAP
jgi:hypothetical protein